MKNSIPNPPSEHRQTTGLVCINLGILAALVWFIWQAIRLPLLIFLVMFEPIVNFTLSALALVVALTTILWRFTDPRAIPFWTVLASSFACVLGLILYHALIRALSVSAR